MTATYRTPAAYARQLGVGVHKILALIASGEIKAVDVRSPESGSPRWRISAEAVADFEARRSNTPATPKPKPRRKRTALVTQYV